MPASEDWEVLSGASRQSDSWSAAAAEAAAAMPSDLDRESTGVDADFETHCTVGTPTASAASDATSVASESFGMDVESMDTESRGGAMPDTPVATPTLRATAAPGRVPQNPAAAQAVVRAGAPRQPTRAEMHVLAHMMGQGRQEGGGDMFAFNAPMLEMQALQREMHRQRPPRMSKMNNKLATKALLPKTLFKSNSHRTMYANERNQ